MDRNKLKVLQDIQYDVRDTCESCAHAHIKPWCLYGECKMFIYRHEKHERYMPLSIVRSGWCSDYKRGEGKWGLDGFEQLREVDERPSKDR